MKKIIFCLFTLMIMIFFVGCSTDIPERTDAQRFKEEYELLNGEISDDKEIRTITIPENNPIVFKSYTEIVDMMKNGDTFIVYFGFASCPWCRACIETFLSCAEEVGTDTVYYVDVYHSRDIYEYNENGEIEKTNEAGEGYIELLGLMDNVLDEYIIKSKDKEDYDVGERRIYAPNFIAVVEGKAVLLEESGDLMEDAYAELTPEIISELTQRYTDLFKSVK